MYTLFACLSNEKIAFGVKSNIKLNIKANIPIIIKYSVDSLINEYIYKTEYDKFNRKYKIESILENVD